MIMIAYYILSLFSGLLSYVMSLPDPPAAVGIDHRRFKRAPGPPPFGSIS
ncbi:hypothetical protein [Rhodopila sp.]